MRPKIVLTKDIPIQTVTNALLAGQVIAIPTETVYGLAADASNEIALKKIFHLKSRPENHPLIIHITTKSDEESIAHSWLNELSRWSRDVPPEAILLAEKFWPGPLTMILKKAVHVSDLVTGDQDTVGIRAPNHPWTIDLIRAFGKGLAAPSANRFGRISPTCAEHVFEEFSNESLSEPLLIIDGGACEIGIESTILDLSRLTEIGPVILRPGMISNEQIMQVIGRDIQYQSHSEIRHSGGMLGHYAPETQLQMKSVATLIAEDFSIGKTIVASFASVKELKVLWSNPNIFWHQLDADPQKIAKDLYRLLREFDHMNAQKIIFDELPQGVLWKGIHDRLTRSVYGSGQS